jgi:hypothetical protein
MRNKQYLTLAPVFLISVLAISLCGCEQEKDAGDIGTEFVEYHISGDFVSAYALLAVSAEEKKSMTQDQYVDLYDSRFAGAGEITELNFKPQKRGEGSITMAFEGKFDAVEEGGTEYTLGGEISLVEEPEGWKVTELDWVSVPTGVVNEFEDQM